MIFLLPDTVTVAVGRIQSSGRRHRQIFGYFKPACAGLAGLFLHDFTKHPAAALQHCRCAAPQAEIRYIFMISRRKTFRIAAMQNSNLRLLTVKMFSDSLVAKQ